MHETSPMNGYVKYFDINNEYINFLVFDEELLKKYNKIWDKVKNLFKREFNSEPVYNNKYINTKIKIYNNRTYTNFQYNKISEDNKYCACLSVILLDSIVVNTDKNVIHKYF